jgi:hypothetical protein
MKIIRTRRTNSEVDRLRDVRDEDRLLLVVLEEAQCARRRVEVDLQHRRRSFVEFLVSSHLMVSVTDSSISAATKNMESRTREGRGNK